MLSTNHPLSSLRRHLGRALAPFNAVSSEPFGRPEFVKRVASEAERVFQGIAKASPSEARVYAAARSFVRGQPLDDYEQHLLA
jgi:hypothetical protein